MWPQAKGLETYSYGHGYRDSEIGKAYIDIHVLDFDAARSAVQKPQRLLSPAAENPIGLSPFRKRTYHSNSLLMMASNLRLPRYFQVSPLVWFQIHARRTGNLAKGAVIIKWYQRRCRLQYFCTTMMLHRGILDRLKFNFALARRR